MDMIEAHAALETSQSSYHGTDRTSIYYHLTLTPYATHTPAFAGRHDSYKHMVGKDQSDMKEVRDGMELEWSQGGHL
jgi:hypothetical protein